MTPLFLDDPPPMQKVSAPTMRMSEQPDNWPLEISQEVFKQLPFLSNYEVSVHIDKTDDQQGYSFGSVDVTSKTLRPIPDAGPPLQSNVRAARIPVVIRERELAPFDVFLIDGKTFPLTEDRFGELMMRPEMFDVMDEPARDPSLIPQLYPPYRSRYGFGGSYEIKQGSLLPSIAGTASEEDKLALLEKLADQPWLRRALLANGGLQAVADVLTKEADDEARTESILSRIKPTVLQLRKLASGDYMLKAANPDALVPQEWVVDPATAEQLAGKDMVAKTDETGVVMSPASFMPRGEIQSGLGSAAVIVLDETTDIVDVALNLMTFYRHESCGQCTPCREGAKWVWDILDRLHHRKARPGDVDTLEDILVNVGDIDRFESNKTICLFGVSFGWPLTMMIRKYREDFLNAERESEAPPLPRPTPLPIISAGHLG